MYLEGKRGSLVLMHEENRGIVLRKGGGVIVLLESRAEQKREIFLGYAYHSARKDLREE